MATSDMRGPADSAPGVVWVTTEQAPGKASHMPKGWRLHAVEGTDADTTASLGRRAARCGKRPAFGWGTDLFIDRKCVACLRAIGYACPACRGRGSFRRVNNPNCTACRGTGEKAPSAWVVEYVVNRDRETVCTLRVEAHDESGARRAGRARGRTVLRVRPAVSATDGL